ncbi:MAG: ROK family protein [Solirubrobacterales bacterium]
MTQPAVFISYASEDKEAGNLLCGRLEAAGIDCWIAPRNVHAGQRYAEAIIEAIESCRVFLILFSANATASPHVRNEIEEAAGHDKAIVLVRIDDADPRANRQVSLFLGSHQWFDASEGALANHFDGIVSAVGRLLDRSTITTSSQSGLRTSSGNAAPGPASVAPLVEPDGGINRAIGIEVGSSRLRGRVVDLDRPAAEIGEPAQYFQKVRDPATARTVLQQTKELVALMLEDHFKDSRPVGIGIAAPGQIDLRAGTLKFGPNLFGARNLPFKTTLSGAFPGIPIRVDNEVRCATRCELHIGAGIEFDSFACMFIGTGVGSGTVIDRRVHFGHNFCAGEIGHVKIGRTGPPCACGQIGCLETFVKAQSVVARAEAKAIDWESRGLKTLLGGSGEPLTPISIVAALAENDEAAQEVADEVGEDLGLGIANYLNVMNPAAVIIGGGLISGFFLYMIDRITHSIQTNALAEVSNTPIIQSGRSEDSIAIGAAFLFHPNDEWPF